VNGDDIAVLDAEVVAHNTVDAGTAVIEIIVGQDNQHSVLALLALDQNCVTTEELEGLHGVVGESNNGVVIVDGIGHTVLNELLASSSSSPHQEDKGSNWGHPYINELGFFFFLRIAVEVSSSC
jgi:hypothetical protein